MIRIKDIMSRHVVELPHTTPVQEAAHVMSEEQVGSVIVTENNIPVGIVTEADMTRKIVAAGCNADYIVYDIMSSPLYFTNLDADITEVANSMTVNNIKKVPVIQGDHVMGIITQTDVIKHVFRVIRSLQRQHAQGTLSSTEFAEKSAAIFDAAEHAHAEKDWYMKCKDCGNTFLNPEQDGAFKIHACPKCGSNEIAYNQDPSVL